MGTQRLPRNTPPEISLISDQPITIPLSVHQQKSFAGLRVEAAKLAERQNIAVTAIIERDYDPATLADWNIQLGETAIICTPPERA